MLALYLICKLAHGVGESTKIAVRASLAAAHGLHKRIGSVQKLGEQRIDPALGRRSFRRFNNGPALRHDGEAAGRNVYNSVPLYGANAR